MRPDEKQKELAVAQEALQKSFIYLASNLGVSDPATEYRILDYMNDELGMRHFRLQQIHEGLLVFGQHLIVHIAKDGEVRDTTGSYRQGVSGMNIEPKLSGDEAMEIARKDSEAEVNEESTAELIIYPEQNGPKNFLAYLVTLPFWRNNIPLKLRYFVDANSGEILFQYNDQPITGEATSTRGIASQISDNK